MVVCTKASSAGWCSQHLRPSQALMWVRSYDSHPIFTGYLHAYHKSHGKLFKSESSIQFLNKWLNNGCAPGKEVSAIRAAIRGNKPRHTALGCKFRSIYFFSVFYWIFLPHILKPKNPPPYPLVVILCCLLCLQMCSHHNHVNIRLTLVITDPKLYIAQVPGPPSNPPREINIVLCFPDVAEQHFLSVKTPLLMKNMVLAQFLIYNLKRHTSTLCYSSLSKLCILLFH